MTTDTMAATSSWNIDDKYLRLKRHSIRKMITLPPKYLGNLSKGIDEAILRSNQEIFKEFNGVPISIDKKVLLQNVGTSIDDYAYIQFYVEMECVIFMPKVGKKVRASVNKIGDTYIGCLICDRINATIFKRNKSGKNSVLAVTEKELDKLYIGQEVIIKIERIQYEQNDLFIVASFEKAV